MGLWEGALERGGKGFGWACEGKGVVEEIRTFEEGGEVVDVDVLGFDAFEEVEKDLVWVLAYGVAEGRGG